MKNFILFITLFVTSASFAAEDIFSFYFNKKSLLSLNSVRTINPYLFAKYEPQDSPENEVRRAAGEHLMVDPSGIYLEKNKLLFISKEEVRENSKYTVRNGWLHGVIEGDSLACALDGDKYYFLAPSKTYLYETDRAPNKLMQIAKTSYAIFSWEDVGHYSVIVLTFTNNGLVLKEVNFTTEGDNGVNKIEEKEELEAEEGGFKTFILSPTKDEWESIVFKYCLVQYDAYSKVVE